MINQRASIAAITLTVIGAATFLVMPVILGSAVAAFGFSEREVGLIAALLMAGNAVSAASALFWVRLLDWRLVARCALLLQCVALAAGTQCDSFIAVGLSFLCASLGGGAVYAVAMTVLSDHEDSERVFGYSITAQVAFQLVGMLMLSHFTVPGGFNQLMWGLSGLVASGLLLASWLPHHENVKTIGSIAGILRQREVSMALLGCLTYFINVGCVWAYVERMGSVAGFSAGGLGMALAFGVAIGMAGSLVAARHGSKFGHVAPLAWGTVGTVLAVTFLLPVTGLTIFVVALALYNFVYNYSLTHQLTVISSADDSGHCVAVAGAFQMVGGAMGPMVAAPLVTSESFVAVSGLAAMSAIVSFVLFLSAARLAVADRR